MTTTTPTATPTATPTSPSEDVIAPLPRNSMHSVVALLVPMVVALVATPYVVNRLGAEPFGLYMLTLSLVGFGGLLDLGFATAAVRFVAEARARGDKRELSAVINTTLFSRIPQILLLVPGGIVLAPLLVDRVLAVSGPLQADAAFLVRVAVVSLGVSMMGGTLAALPRAAHRYDIASRLALLFSLLLTGSTVLILVFGGGLRQIVLAELALTVGQFLLYWHVAKRVLPAWRFEWRVDPAWLRRIAAFGIFVTLNTVTAIVFIHVNRILVGRFLGIVAVTYFVVPWSLSSKITQVVASLTEAISPVASALATSTERPRLRDLCLVGGRFSAAVAGTLGIPLILGASDLLALWMGPAFASHSARLLRLLAFSGSIQALTTIPYFVLSGLGHAAAANIPVALGALVSLLLSALLIPRAGLEGIGVALSTAVLLQAVLLYRALDHALPGSSPWTTARLLKAGIASAAALSAGFASYALLPTGFSRLLVLAILGVALFHALLAALSFYEPSDGVRALRSLRIILGPFLGKAAPLSR